MKTRQFVSFFVFLMIVAFAVIGGGEQPDYSETVTLTPEAPEPDEPFTATLAPQEMAIYNVTIHREGTKDEIAYELDEDMDPNPSVTKNPAADPNLLWVWNDQAAGGGNNPSYEFKIVNTIWDEKTVTVTVKCTWVPVPGDGNGGEGEAPGPIHGKAEGIALHQWGALVPTSDIGIDGAPDYLCINEAITLSSWLVLDEFEHENYELIEANWSVESICDENGAGDFDVETADTVVFTPTSPGKVRVTATESQYEINSGTVEFTIFELAFVNDEDSKYNFSPSLSEEAKIKVSIEPSLDLDFPSYSFGIQIVRFTKTGTEQSIGWVPLDDETSMVPVDFGVETFTWNGKAGESVPAVDGPAEFTGVNDNTFHRHLPAVAENDNLPPPVYTALAKITTPAGDVICQAEQTIFVPQIVKLAYDADAVSLIRQSLSYIDEAENEHELFEALSAEGWNAVRAQIRSNAEDYYSDANVNLRIIDESDSPGSPCSTITFSKGTEGQNTLGQAPFDFPNMVVDDEGWHYAHGYRWNVKDFATTVEYTPERYGTLDEFFPVTQDELAKYVALTVAHEIGHMLGLVDEDDLGGDNGNHNPYIPPGNSSDIMDESPRGLWRAIGREVDEEVIEWTWKELNADYMRFILPEGE